MPCLPPTSIASAWGVIGVAVALFCSLSLPPRVGAFQPVSITLQPNNGNSSLWPVGFYGASYGLSNATGERELWIIGGKEAAAPYPGSNSTVRIYNLDTNAWTSSVDTVGVIPLLNDGVGTVLNNAQFVAFGDPYSVAPIDFPPPVYVLDLATRVWTTVDATGGPLSMHGIVVVANPVNQEEIIVFGGGAMQNKTIPSGGYVVITNQMWAFNVATSLWRNVTYSGSVVPPPVFRHKGTVAGNSLYVFGGQVCNITEAFYCNATTYLNTTWSFDFTTSTWQELTNAIMPLPRTGHSLATVNDGQELVLFGGVPYNNKIQLNDIWVFNIAEANWTEIILQYPLPTPSYGQFLYPFAFNQVLLIGGLNQFNYPMYYLNRVALIDIGVPHNDTLSPNSTSSTPNQAVNVELHFPNNVPALTFTPIGSSCSSGTAFMRVQVNQIQEMYVFNNDPSVHLPAAQTVNFLDGLYSVHTNSSDANQAFDFSRNLGATKFGFSYSLAQQTITVNYLGTQFELSPSDIKLSLSVADWQWAEAYLGVSSSLQLVLRTTLMVYADTPFTSLSSEYDPESQQTIYKITSQDVAMTIGFSDRASADQQIKNVTLSSIFSPESITLNLDLPYFGSNITYDPNFSVLLTGDNGCGGGPDLLAIVLPSVLGGLALITVIAVITAGMVFFYWRRRLLVKRVTLLHRSSTSLSLAEAGDAANIPTDESL